MTNLEKYLKLIGKQEKVKEEEITIKRNITLEKIIKSYELWLAQQDREDYAYNSQDEYNHILKTYSRKRYSSKDIEDFSLELLEYQNRKYFENTGLFLSALINKSKAQEFTIITEHLDKKIDLIGYENKKIVNVKGDAGNYVGWNNKGTVTIEGDAGDDVGWYNKGTVTIEGDAGNDVGVSNKGTITIGRDAGSHVGLYNKGTVTIGGDARNVVGLGNKGTVTIEGDAGDDVGLGNKGTVRVNGKIKSLHKNASGKIYQGGKLIKCQI